MNNQQIEKLSFEDALQKLENIVRDLESGQIKLDAAVEAYEQAAALKKICEDKLKTAQLKVEKIQVSSDESVSLTALDKVED